MSDSLWTHVLQHARPPCLSPTPRVYPNSCPLNQWCHPTISSSVIPFSSRPQSFPASGSFQMSQLFELGGQRIGVSAATSALPMNTQDWSPLGWTGWISLMSKGLSRVFSNTAVQSINSLASAFLIVQLSYPYMTTGKTIALTRWTFVAKVMSLLIHVQFFVTPHKSGLPFPSSRDLHHTGIKPRSPVLQTDSLPSEPLGKPPISSWCLTNRCFINYSWKTEWVNELQKCQSHEIWML